VREEMCSKSKKYSSELIPTVCESIVHSESQHFYVAKSYWVGNEVGVTGCCRSLENLTCQAENFGIYPASSEELLKRFQGGEDII